MRGFVFVLLRFSGLMAVAVYGQQDVLNPLQRRVGFDAVSDPQDRYLNSQKSNNERVNQGVRHPPQAYMKQSTESIGHGLTSMKLAGNQLNPSLTRESVNSDRGVHLQSGDQKAISSSSTQAKSVAQASPEESASGIHGFSKAIQKDVANEMSSSTSLSHKGQVASRAASTQQSIGEETKVSKTSSILSPSAMGGTILSKGSSSLASERTTSVIPTGMHPSSLRGSKFSVKQESLAVSLEGGSLTPGTLSREVKKAQGNDHFDHSTSETESAQSLGSMLIKSGGGSRYQSTSRAVYPDHVSGYAVGASDAQSTGKVVPSSAFESNNQTTTLSKSKHGKFSVEENIAECVPLKPREIPVTATWLSSFPGSGSRLTWRLIESITGLSTGDDLDTNGQVAKGVAVTVKTHYPSHATERVFKQEKLQGISRAILVLRNPMYAIPALFRFVYFVEQKNHDTNNSKQPPIKAWFAWRNEYFETELRLWVEHVKWWMMNYKRENLHLLPFEYLSSPERGSDELLKVGNFLGSADQVVAFNLLQPEKFCCVWEKIVDQTENAGSFRRKKPIYTANQLEALIQALINLRDENKAFPEFFRLMDEYLGEIVETKTSIVAMTKPA